ncbi:MAG: cytochrome c nitrite reductase small subunit [Flavobacteriaceae bacterium]|nr:cytochrome c nitrite reductase small subunit [Flavobacteriaceae bacterium]
MLKLLRYLKPPKNWHLQAIFLLGAIAGFGLYAAIESNAVSYLSDDPKACVNCHVMTPEYVSWQRSSHREVANCNDCHVPHENYAKKMLFKAKDGLYHASVFTTKSEPQVIQMKEASAQVVQSNCIRCHENQVTDAKLSGTVTNHYEHRASKNCWECHKHVPHGRVHSLSSVKYYGKIPSEHQETVPEWLKKQMTE